MAPSTNQIGQHTSYVVLPGQVERSKREKELEVLCEFIKIHAFNLKAKKLAEQAHVTDYDALKQIDVLDLTGAFVTSLPEELSHLANLIVLDMTANKLTTLPDSIVDLKKLKILILRGNNFKSVPEQLKQMTGLTKIDILENPIKEVPASLSDKINELPYGAHWIEG